MTQKSQPAGISPNASVQPHAAPSTQGSADARTSSDFIATRDKQSGDHLRRDLQQQCLRPSGLSRPAPFESRIAAWLYLLGISEEDIRQHAQSLPQSAPQAAQSTPPNVSSIVADSLTSPIPLDDDGWQVASDDILQASTSQSISKNYGHHDSNGSSAARNDDGWKVVKSKKAKRRKEADALSNASSPDLAHSTQSSSLLSGESSATSTPAMSPNPDKPAASVDSRGLGISEDAEKPKSEALTDHQRFPNLSARDIEQVAKDVERSFIGPAFKQLFASSTAESGGNEDTPRISDEKVLRRRQLSHLILTTLSRHPSLSYFQGYHDILSVVLLTLAPPPSSAADEPALASQLFADDTHQSRIELIAERISLHVIRDSMTRDLLPIMGQLKVLAALLHLADPTLAELVDRASPMPFFALPWLLTLLTHDATDVAVMQRVLEFVLAYGPAAAIYLCAAVLLARKEEILGMDEDELEDPAMLHTILGRLPLIRADKDGEEVERAESTAEGEERSSGKLGGREGSASHDSNAIYTDPDVELPSLASDRALAASRSSPAGGAQEKRGIPISTLLQSAVELLKRFPLDTDAVQADKIMGTNSVLFTWPRIFDPSPAAVPSDKASHSTEANTQISLRERRIDWTSANELAESILTGPTEAIVLDPHPSPPTPPASDGSFGEEKAGNFDHQDRKDGKRRGRKPQLDVSTHHARMLAVVGLSGLLVAALFTASQNPASSAAAAQMAAGTTEETKRVLTLIVSLLSSWGRVVGSA